LGGSEHTVKENAEKLVAACKEIGLEVNGDKTKYMFMSGDKNAERIHSVKILFEMMEEIKYLVKKFNKSNLYSGINHEQIEIRESYVIIFSIQKFED